jgi:hypothetical protein
MTIDSRSTARATIDADGIVHWKQHYHCPVERGHGKGEHADCMAEA